MRFRVACVMLLTLLMASTAFAQRRNLSVGDQAPGLDIEKWVKGQETAISEDSVYIVEFWATWCIPCRQSIPHLTAWQEAYGHEGLTVIGVSTEEPEVVERFVRSQGDKMEYTVAVDRRGGTERAWHQAADLKGIPSLFLVDKKGKIQFIGNPLADHETLETILPLVLDGRYDAKLYERMAPMIKAAKRARKIRNWRMYEKHMGEVIKEDPHVFALFTLDLFETKLIDQNDSAAAYQYAREVAVQYTNDPTLLGHLAEKIATDPKIPAERRDMSLALEIARAAAMRTVPEDPDRYAIEALVLFHAGQFDEAIQLQRRAYHIARPHEKANYKRVLDAYMETAKRESARVGS